MTDTASAPGATPQESWHIGRLITAWVVATLLASSVVAWAPQDQRFEWIALAVGATILVSFVLQLGTAQRNGFITRLSYSVVGGSFFIGVVELVAFIVSGR